jgi:hypothetical protein
MIKFPRFLIYLCVLLVSNGVVEAKKGLSLRGGFLRDTPRQDVFEDMESGVGYIAGIGYEFFEFAGADLGVMHSTHEFRLGVRGNAVVNDKAEKTALFIRARFLPLKTAQNEIELGAGPAFYSITGNTETAVLPFPGEEGFSGWGYTIGLDLRHFATDNLAVSFYFSANMVKYNKQTLNTRDVEPPTRLPRGDSYCWGLNLFYRIGNFDKD